MSRHYEKFADGTVKYIEEEIPFEIPESWRWCRLNSICCPLKYGTSNKSQKKGKIAVLRMGNIQSGIIDYSNLVFSNNEQDNKQYLLKTNDLLFNRTNSPELEGKTGIYKGKIPAIYAGYLICLRTINLNADYINCVMNSDYQRNYCQLVKTNGVSQSNINAEKIGNLLIPLPPYNEQLRIAITTEEITPFIMEYDRLGTKLEYLEQDFIGSFTPSFTKKSGCIGSVVIK